MRYTISMYEIRRLYALCRSHWFDRETRRFFACRLPKGGYRGADGSAYFVSSERPPFGERRYTIRRVTPGKVETVGEFLAYRTARAARRAALAAAMD